MADLLGSLLPEGYAAPDVQGALAGDLVLAKCGPGTTPREGCAPGTDPTARCGDGGNPITLGG
jgi:hypothetical protein